MYVLKDVPGKGRGLIATERITKGTRILSEHPVITIPEGRFDHEWLKTHIVQQVNALDERQQQSFYSLHNIHPYQNVSEQSLGILRTNALPIEENGIDGGIFLEACRINHSCDNNAHKNWNQHIQRHTVYALRDIAEGEEITIYYLGLDSSRKIRQEKLLDRFGFLCSCRLCSLPNDQSQESDKRIERIAHLDELIGSDGNRMHFSLRTLRYVDERVGLYNEQGPGDSGLPRAYFDAAQIAIANGDLARGRIFAERAVEGWRTAYGTESQEVIRNSFLARTPDQYQLYGLSMKWKTSFNEVPTGLDPEDFEDWLWRREKPKLQKQIEQLVNLRNRKSFPSFSALPSSHRDSEWYEEVEGIYRPLRPWYVLGEVASYTEAHHIELRLMDIDGQEAPLSFSTDEIGEKIYAALLQEGHTVVVLYGKREKHWICCKDSEVFQILPLSLKKLLELNDLLQLFSSDIEGLRTCHGCGKQSHFLKKCGKCSLFWYCAPDCQRIGWIKKGHKLDCKLLRGSALRGLFEGGKVM